MEKTITEFLDQDYKSYAFYVLENRAIPSCIDSFKPTQRKVMHIAHRIWKRGGNAMKVFQLTGRVTAEAFYDHGDASCNSVIINMAQKFKNNLPLLEEIGQFGSLRAPDAGAPRYIATKLNSAFLDVYKDFELIETRYEEGNEIEPAFFLPIIPMLLVNGAKGIAVGYATNVLGRDPKAITKQCINWLAGKRLTTIRPQQQEFSGIWSPDPENPKKWYATGTFVRENTTTLRITELAPSMTYEKWEALLDKLLEKKEIVDFEDNSKSSIDYIIKFNRAKLKDLTDEEIIKMFKLQDSEIENFTTLDENGKLKIFEDFKEIIEYFMQFRLNYYEKRRLHLIDRLQKKFALLKNRAIFIKLVIDQKIILNNRPKKQVEQDIIKNKLEPVDDSYNYLLSMQISSLTKEMFQQLVKEAKESKKELEEIHKKTAHEMFSQDLQDLYQKL